eukprot:UN09394
MIKMIIHDGCVEVNRMPIKAFRVILKKVPETPSLKMKIPTWSSRKIKRWCKQIFIPAFIYIPKSNVK